MEGVEMNILILGNLGYVGPVLVNHLHKRNIGSLTGLDTAYFAHNLTTNSGFPERYLNEQKFKDVRCLEPSDFNGINAVVYLAAISNDPMGNEFEAVTLDVNRGCALKAAKLAKASGVSSFVFASSCSVYGAAGEGKRTEDSPLNPLTAYARSKVGAEEDLQLLASRDFQVTCLRFATACGFSPRLRLDLVLNDFVATALASGKIDILSDGTPWRPLIHVRDMARAIEWALVRNRGDEFLAINTGSNDWNYQIKDLAQAVAQRLAGVEVHINQNAAPDKRSYQVDFSRFAELAPDHQPEMKLKDTVDDLYEGLTALNFNDTEFRNSALIRLNVIRDHLACGRLDQQLFWR